MSIERIKAELQTAADLANDIAKMSTDVSVFDFESEASRSAITDKIHEYAVSLAEAAKRAHTELDTVDVAGGNEVWLRAHLAMAVNLFSQIRDMCKEGTRFDDRGFIELDATTGPGDMTVDEFLKAVRKKYPSM